MKTLAGYCSSVCQSRLTDNQFSLLMQELYRLRSDVRYLKGVVEKKQAKKAARREKRRLEELAREQKAWEERQRRSYEEIIRLLTESPWKLWPAPKGIFSPKEEEVVRLLASGKSDAKIAAKMGLKEGSIAARVCVINKRLNFKHRDELVASYFQHVQSRKEHRRCRCLRLLSWLFDPPTGRIARSNFKVSWRRRLGKAKTYQYAGPFITDEIFRYVKLHKLEAWKMKMKGMTDEEIAAKLKVRKSTSQSYLSEVRSRVQRTALKKVSLSSARIAANIGPVLKPAECMHKDLGFVMGAQFAVLGRAD